MNVTTNEAHAGARHAAQAPQLGSCEICGSRNLTELLPMEMMRGDGGPFRYVHCRECGSTYQPEKLSDYGKYYPASYYSFQYSEPRTLSARLRQLKRRLRNRYYYFSRGILGRLLAGAKPLPVNHLARHVRLRPDMDILEIGSGSGELLHELADLGIRTVVGVDPFIPQDISYRNGARVYKIGVHQLAQRFGDRKFDLIMFNHSLEHSPTPIDDLRAVTGFLRDGGEILIRFPVSGSELAEHYGKHWWSLDAPRHIYLFSAKSVGILAEKCGLKVKRSHFEGTIDDFLASEQHKAGIPLLGDASYVVTNDLSAFSTEQLRDYAAAIDRQNKAGTAALAGFVLSF